jgi:predicted transcriptional regulator
VIVMSEEQTTKTTKISNEAHKKVRLLAAYRDLPRWQIVSEAIEKAWQEWEAQKGQVGGTDE